MSSINDSEKIASQIAHSASNLAFAAFKHHIENKLGKTTVNKETANSNPNINCNEPKSF